MTAINSTHSLRLRSLNQERLLNSRSVHLDHYKRGLSLKYIKLSFCFRQQRHYKGPTMAGRGGKKKIGNANEPHDRRLSKALSWLLRHHIELTFKHFQVNCSLLHHSFAFFQKIGIFESLETPSSNFPKFPKSPLSISNFPISLLV